MTNSPREFIKGAGSLIAGLGVTIKAFFQPVVTSQYPRQLLQISPRFRGHTKLVADSDNPDKNGCIACGICVKNCPSSSIKNVEGEKREGEKRKTATAYMLPFLRISTRRVTQENISTTIWSGNLKRGKSYHECR